MSRAFRSKLLACAAAWVAAAACGQKGPPLPPLHLVPAAATDVSVRRVEDRVRLRFVLPSKNANGPGPVDLDHVDIFAMTIPAGAGTPPNRELLSRDYLVGQVAVRPAPVEGEEPKEDTRPEPGATVTFDEPLTPASLTPVPRKVPPAPKPPAPATAATPQGAAAPASTGAAAAPREGSVPPESATAPTPQGAPPAPESATAATPPGTPPATSEAATAATPQGAPPVAPGVAAPGTSPATQAAAATQAPAAPGHALRVYVLRGVTKSGRPGAPSPRVNLPLIALPPPPSDIVARFTETAVVLEWTPPVYADAPLVFNVYAPGDPMQPVNAAPLPASPFEYAGVKFGAEVCLSVRSARVAENLGVEGPLSPEKCVTPRDIFPPAAPQGLAAVPTPGQISLIWNANTEQDLAGYIVLRGDASGGDLTPLTPAPIGETSYRDGSVTPGARYIYAVVAVDSAEPRNTSAQSARVEETAR